MAQAEYITTTEFEVFFDSSQLFKLCTDNPAVIPTTLSGEPIAEMAIRVGSAAVESYALKGGRYSIDTLADLKAADDHTLKSLTALIAVEWLYKRRAGIVPPAILDNITRAYATLEDLANGKQVFNDPATIAAGKSTIHVIAASTRTRLHLVSDGPQYPHRITTTA